MPQVKDEGVDTVDIRMDEEEELTASQKIKKLKFKIEEALRMSNRGWFPEPVKKRFKDKATLYQRELDSLR